MENNTPGELMNDKMYRRYKRGWVIWAVFFAFEMGHTIGFGFNALPKTTGEIICDIIGLSGCAIGTIMWASATFWAIRKVYNHYKELMKELDNDPPSPTT